LNRNEDSTTWKRASSATDEIIESPQLVHEVSGLQPATSYRVQVAVRLRDLHNIVVSPVTQFTTPPDGKSNHMYLKVRYVNFAIAL
jgi:hypothetical protein